jgi:hypothetical protein
MKLVPFVTVRSCDLSIVEVKYLFQSRASDKECRV